MDYGILKNRWGSRHQFKVCDNSSAINGIYNLNDDSLIGGPKDPGGEIRIGLAGDWGTGTDEANEVAEQIMQFRPHYTIHLGDVYYVGDTNEVEENCLGIQDPKHNFTPCLWPVGSVGSFALNGNHEMYALGNAYFDRLLSLCLPLIQTLPHVSLLFATHTKTPGVYTNSSQSGTRVTLPVYQPL